MNNRLVYERNNKGESKRYVYDNKGNLQQKSVNGVVTNYQYSYERGEGRKERYINKIIETYKDEVVISSYKGQGLYGARKEYSVNEYEKDKELNMYVMVFNNKNSFVQYRSSSFNKYKDKNWQERYKENNTFYMWVKFIGEIGTENLVRFRKDTQEIASVSVDSEGRLSYNEGKIKTQGKVRLNEWNLVGVRQLKEGVSLILNDEITKQINLQIKIKEIDNVVISDQQGTKEMKMIIKVSYMFFSAYRYTNNQISILYKEGKESLVKKEEEEKANLTIYYDEKVYKGYDVITLCGSIESGKGNRAQRIEESQEENIYKYDKGSGKLIYGCYSGDKNKLSYNLNMRLSGTISLMFKLKENIVKERTIISNRLQEIEELGIKITSDKKVKIIVNDESEILETKVTENKWNNVIVSYSGTKLEIYLNGEKIRSKSDKVISLSYCETYIGIDPKEEESELEGQVEMLAYKGSGVIDAVEASSISKNGRSKVIKEKYDELGKKESSEIEGYKVSYRYEKERIESEIDDSHEVIKYEYEKGSNRVSKKIRLFDNVVEREERYQYDSKGQIVKEIRNKEEINYSYDKEGNLIKENNKEYIYNSGRLVRVVEGNTLIQEIMYDETKDKYKPINLIVNGSREDLRYEGRRLIGIGKDISYEYDGEGRRISKTVKGNKEEYKYEGERLVKIIKEGREIEVLYDIKGEIVGLKNEEGYYYYRKDALGNIERIIDSTGKTIVKYEYSVWGELIEEKEIENKKIVEDNPYKYKSYYYDKESGLYYLKSRYYSASLHRFISLDQTEYMEIGSITGLNLYVYCGNDPVNMADPDGCAPKWLQIVGWVGFAIGATLCIASTIILFSGLSTATFIGAVVIGAAKGSLIGAGIGFGVGAVVGGVGAVLNGEEFGSKEFWSDFLYGGMAGFGVGAIVGAVYGGFYGANGWYNAKALEFTNSGSSEVFLGKDPTYYEIAQKYGGTSFHVSNEVWNSTASMKGVNMWKINKAFLKQQIALKNKFVLTSYNITGMYAKEVAYVMSHGGVWAFLV